MSFARKLYERFRLLLHEVAKFGVVGGIAFIVTELFFNLLIQLGLDTFAANAGSTLLAAVVAFAGNRYWTFRHRERTGMGRETVLFFVFNGVGILIQQACIELAKHEFGLARQAHGERRVPGRGGARHAVQVLVVPQVGVAACRA